MSRFFAAGSDSDSSTSDSDGDVSLASESSVQSTADQAKKTNFNQFLKKTGGDDSDSEEDSKTVIRSARDKRYEEMRTRVSAIQNAVAINDWVSIQAEFDKLQKQLLKFDVTIKREGIPRFYIRTLTGLQEAIEGPTTKKMNPSTSKAYNAMKQKIKKVFKIHEEAFEKFSQSPVDELDSADEAEELALKAEEELAAAKTKAVKFVIEEEDDDGFVMEKVKVVEKVGSIILFERLAEIIEARGKKNTDKFAQVEALSMLVKQSFTPYQRIKCIMALISARFDAVPISSGLMSTETWTFAREEISTLLDLLSENPHITIGDALEDDTTPEDIRDKQSLENVAMKLPGAVVSFVDRLDDEFTKSLQNIDPHTAEYIERLKDEILLYGMLIRIYKYAVSICRVKEELDMIIMRKVEHLYYKPDAVIQIFEGSNNIEKSSSAVVDLCNSISNSTIENIRTRSLLCHIYHIALHDQYFRARDMMLISKLQDNINQSDLSTQGLFNRSMVQIGLSAFRCGLFREAHICLQDISSSGRTKELLVQGISGQSKYMEKTAEQERLEKQRHIPFHMHVNLELLECIYLTCAMLLEIPNMALHHDARRKIMSKSYRRMLDYNERQVFTGPPENMRDHIMAASKAMAKGEWESCKELIFQIKTWNLLPNAATMKQMLERKIKQESLRTYILTFSRFYDDLKLSTLAENFGLEINDVRSIVSRMIMHEEIRAYLQGDDDVKLIRSISSKLDQAIGVLLDKITILVDANEKTADLKWGVSELSPATEKVRKGSYSRYQ